MKTFQTKPSQKSKKIFLNAPKVKMRGKMPPPSVEFKPKVAYNRKAFKNFENWEE